MGKCGSIYEELTVDQLQVVEGGATPTLTTISSAWCFGASMAVSGGISASATFIVSAT